MTQPRISHRSLARLLTTPLALLLAAALCAGVAAQPVGPATRLGDLNPNGDSHSGYDQPYWAELVPAGPLLYSTTGNELWRSDGTAAGTARVRSFEPYAMPRELTALGGALFFALDAGSYTQLWRSDGTPEGTALVIDGAQQG